MKKVSYFLILLMASTAANAKFDADLFISEIETGVDMVAAPRVALAVIDDAPGMLGQTASFHC